MKGNMTLYNAKFYLAEVQAFRNIRGEWRGAAHQQHCVSDGRISTATAPADLAEKQLSIGWHLPCLSWRLESIMSTEGLDKAIKTYVPIYGSILAKQWMDAAVPSAFLLVPLNFPKKWELGTAPEPLLWLLTITLWSKEKGRAREPSLPSLWSSSADVFF